MTIAHYIHRLPADYDIGIIRSRAKERGALWNDVPELHFKGFLLRERGRFGAIASSYSSLYLWRTDEAFRNFLVSGRYKVVTDSFGRADIQTRFALDAQRGRAKEARFVCKQEVSIPIDADLTAAIATEIARNRDVAEGSETVAAIVASIRRTGPSRASCCPRGTRPATAVRLPTRFCTWQDPSLTRCRP